MLELNILQFLLFEMKNMYAWNLPAETQRTQHLWLPFYFFVEDDWELSHRKLSGLNSEGTHEAKYDEWLKKKGFELQSSDLGLTTTKELKRTGKEDPEDELDREEVK